MFYSSLSVPMLHISWFLFLKLTFQGERALRGCSSCLILISCLRVHLSSLLLIRSPKFPQAKWPRMRIVRNQNISSYYFGTGALVRCKRSVGKEKKNILILYNINLYAEQKKGKRDTIRSQKYVCVLQWILYQSGSDQLSPPRPRLQ